MSYSLHNPHASEGQNASQGQNELGSGQRESDPGGMMPILGPESGLNFPGTFSGTPALSGEGVTAQRSLPTGYRPEVGRTALSPNLKETLNLNICARDELNLQQVSQNPLGKQPNVLPSSATQICIARILPVLRAYGLDYNDLDELMRCPEEQIKAVNLPHTLNKICLKKAMRASVQSDPTAQPSTSAAVQETCLQPSEVTTCGLSGKPEDRSAEFISCTAKTGENSLLLGSFKSSSYSEEVPESMTRGWVPSYDQLDPIDHLSPMRNVMAPLNSDVAGLQSTPNQTSLPIFATSSLPNEAEDTTVPNPEEVIFVSSKESGQCSTEDVIYVSSEESSPDSPEEPVSHFAAKTLPTSSLDHNLNLARSVGHVDRNEDGFADNQRETQSSKVVETRVIHQTQKSEEKPSMFHMWQGFISNSKPLPSSFVSTVAIALDPVQSSTPVVSDPTPCVISPSRPALGQANAARVLSSKWVPTPKNPPSKGFPSRDMMTDYAAAQPKIFPHTCSLCKKKCDQLKVS